MVSTSKLIKTVLVLVPAGCQQSGSYPGAPERSAASFAAQGGGVHWAGVFEPSNFRKQTVISASDKTANHFLF